jgi:hypothetical protein
VLSTIELLLEELTDISREYPKAETDCLKLLPKPTRADS